MVNDEASNDIGFKGTRKVFLDNVFGPEAILAADKSLVCELATYLYKNGDDQEKTRALLCHVYFLALHNKHRLARELFLMSHVAVIPQLYLSTQ